MTIGGLQWFLATTPTYSSAEARICKANRLQEHISQELGFRIRPWEVYVYQRAELLDRSNRPWQQQQQQQQREEVASAAVA